MEDACVGSGHAEGDGMSIIFNRAWAMPSANTFSIKPIKELVMRNVNGVSIDPFSNTSKIASVTNDLCKEYECDYSMDALEFVKMFDDASVDCVLFDPPYSSRQVSECYKKEEMTVNMETTQSSFWGDMKNEISRVVRRGGVVVTCGWNTNGIGLNNGFEIKEILMVAHGGWHNDTIVTVEERTSGNQMSFV